MPIEIEGITYYRTSEACRLAGISKATFYRGLENGTLQDIPLKDGKGWRLFTDHDIDQIKLHVLKQRIYHTPFSKKKNKRR